MKEITPYFLKIHGLYAALDVMNKVWSFFGMVQAHPLRACMLSRYVTEHPQRLQVLRDYAVDSVASIACSCNSLYEADSANHRGNLSLRILSDAVISWLLISLSGLIMMCQAIMYSVVLNSGQNSIVALLIATKLLEVKGIVYKRYDERKLLDMARMV